MTVDGLDGGDDVVRENVRVIKPNLDTVSAIRERLRNRGFVDIASSGTSMYPLIRHGDICRFESVQYVSRVKIGDVLLYAQGGQLVGHRLLSVEWDNSRTVLYCKGDANIFADEVIVIDQVLGKLVRIRKARATIHMSTWPTQLVGFLAMRVPAYSKCMRWYLSTRGIRGLLGRRRSG